MKCKGRYNHTEAFKYFGTEPTNIQWSWSARSEETKTVVVTVWDHEFRTLRGRYSFEGSPDMEKLGAQELSRNLQWALTHCGRRVHIIRAFARDRRAKELKIDYCIPASFTMRIAHHDLDTGKFLLQIELPEQLAA